MRGSAERRRVPGPVLAGAAALLGAAGLLAAVLLRGAEHAPPAAPAVGRDAHDPPAPADLVGAHQEADSAAPPPAVASERVPVASGIRGRVVEAGTGAPVPGVEVERTFAGSAKERARSGPDGAFAFPAAVPRHGSLAAVVEGWRFRPERVSLLQTEPGDELVFEGERIVTVPLRGRLVEESTGTPIPRYRLGFGKGEPHDVWAVTDEEGRFETPVGIATGKVGVLLSEAAERRTLEHAVVQGVALEHELAVRLGPTYFFDLDAPEGLEAEGLGVMLVRIEPASRWLALPALTARSHAHHWRASYLLAGTPIHGVMTQSAQVRADGDPAWARFPPLPEKDLLLGPGGYALIVSGYLRAGVATSWTGAGYPAQLSGVQEQRIPVRLERICGLGGDISNASPYAVVTLRGAGSQSLLTCATYKGGFHFEVPAGAYELAAEALHGVLPPLSIELQDAWKKVTLELQPRATIDVAGTVRSRTGTLVDCPPLELRSLTDPRLRFVAEVRYPSDDPDPGTTVELRSLAEPSLGVNPVEGLGGEDVPLIAGDERVGSFDFRGVPAGSYELLARTFAGVACEPSRIAVEGSSTHLELVWQDGFDRATLTLALHPAGGGEAKAVAWIEGEGRMLEPSASRSPHQPAFSVPAEASVRWLAFAAGTVPVEGTWRAGEPEGGTVDVRLERGAGFIVVAVDPWQRGIEGVEVLLDGAPAGHTNEQGYALFSRTPASVEARKDGWVSLEASVDLARGAALLRLVPEG